MVQRALSDKIYLSLGLLSPLILRFINNLKRKLCKLDHLHIESWKKKHMSEVYFDTIFSSL